ncbi:polysaccharide biosynthesis protein [Bacteroides cellulosilyticus]|uniref:Polysaccharide biosynthesis protein n=1 Tax=Bacteroides cellulosilyticus TaxID=246787 RepID=A0A412IN87_9BACE|nr:nucleoside-diphosphate sugar epimerase/dehydratase [Bacteroides cellulosilyticus]RGS39363.1 polysaccharide biosynthesis protein [Bacteroides cellulosilyticus]
MKLTRFFQWCFSQKALPYWCILLLDCATVILSVFIVLALNYGILYVVSNASSLVSTLLVYLLCYVIGFKMFHTYSGVFRYSSFVDLQRAGFAVMLGLVLIIIARMIFSDKAILTTMQITDVVLSAFLSIMLLWALRIIIKYLYDSNYYQEQPERVFIYGVKQGGIGLAKNIRNQDPAKYILAGFVSEASDIRYKSLLGVSVYANDKNLVSEMKKKHANILFVSPLKNEILRNNLEMVNRLIENRIKIFIVPEVQEWDGKSEFNHTQLKEIEIEDLLPREKIEVDMESIGRVLQGKKILITGAAGSIGSEMVRQVAIYNPSELILIDQAETPLHDIRLMIKRCYPDVLAYTLIGDIANQFRMEDIFRQHCPDYVFHAAAYKHVPMMEDNPQEGIQNNVNGTRIVADLSVKYGVKKFVMISTDKAVNPTNVMGCSKRICEIYVQSLDKAIKDGKVNGDTEFITTRFGNVLGSNGSVIPLFKEQIKNGGPVTVTDPNIVRFFMLIPEACKLVLEAGTKGHGGEIFVFDMGKAVKIVDLARRMIQLSGVDIDIKFTGLRDGEKLYEEVLNNKETTLPTFHPKIKIAKVRMYDYVSVCKSIEELVEHSYENDDMQIVKIMKNIVPEFKSQHSKYEVLDLC